MRRGSRRLAAVSLMAGLLLSACSEPPPDEHVVNEPVTLEPIEGTELSRVILTAKAAERLDIQTAPVEGSGQQVAVPSAAVIVDPNGDFWVYTRPEPLIFVRHSIGLDHEERGRAFLSEGPPVGTDVVTVGVAELYGAEFGVG